jgi:membrane protein YdbS with pleckstrin-like domain
MSDAAAAPATEWRRLPENAAQVAMASGLLWSLILGLGLDFLLLVPVRRAFEGGLPVWLVMAALSLLAMLVLGTWLGYRSWKFTTWKLDDTGLHLRRGRYWQKEILVPRSRVQHLDLERGPIERHFGLATLVVHTAGTRHHAVRQPGFSEADALALRDALVPASARHDDVL